MPMLAQSAILEQRHRPVFTICLHFDGSERHTFLSTVSPLHCCEMGAFF
jgi:hypothetical protein